MVVLQAIKLQQGSITVGEKGLNASKTARTRFVSRGCSAEWQSLGPKMPK